MSNIISELKGRSVLKVVTACVVVGWLVLQVVTTVFPTEATGEVDMSTEMSTDATPAVVSSIAVLPTAKLGANLDDDYIGDYDPSRFAAAIDRYKKVTALAPDNSVGFDKLGNAYLSIGELELAEEALNAATSPSQMTYNNRGLVYYLQGRYEQAVADQLKAIEFAPNEHRAWGRLADTYRHMPAKTDAAVDAYRIAISKAEEELAINPSNWDSLIRLSKYYAQTDQADAGRELLDEVLALTSDPSAYYLAAITMLQLGDSDKSYDYLSRSIDGGFSKSIIMNDPDLAPLRADNEFRAWLAFR